jgi:hypothetical protein
MSMNNAVDKEKERLPQIEFGTKITFPDIQPTFVFASLWPSWLFAVKALSYKNVVVCVEDGKPGVEAISRVGLPEGGKWLDWTRWKVAVKTHMSQVNTQPALILFQGPRDAHNRLLEFLNKLQVDSQKAHIMAFLTGDTEGKRSSRKRQKLMRSMEVYPIATISHQMVGGIIDHTWTLESNLLELESTKPLLERQSRVRAALSDYLSHTQGGKTIELAPVESSEGNPKLPWKKCRFNVVAHSVVSPTGWVRRGITLDELMDLYDIGVIDRKLMKEALGHTSDEYFPREFTQQVPVRALIRCLDIMTRIKRENKLEVPSGFEKASDYKVVTQARFEKDFLDKLKQGRLQKDTGGVSEGDKLQAKNDDATARVDNWNRRVCAHLGCHYQPELHDAALDQFWKLELRWYRSHKGGAIRSFWRYMVSEYGEDWLSQLQSRHRTEKRKRGWDVKVDLIKDYEVGIDAISRALSASFWEWDDGSTVFFWRWTREHRNELRDGLKVWFKQSELPNYWGRQRWPEDQSHREQLREKLSKVVWRRYVSSGFVKSLTSFFAVPKGVGDIRGVYDATKSGLNKAIWAPNFCLPNIASVLHNSDDKTFYGDIDIGEMFLNYFLDPDLRPWAGVDLSGGSASIIPEKEAAKRVILRWNRSLMGVRSSPFNCVRAYLISEEIIKGDCKDKGNPFRWHRVILILPGTKKYDPSRPWLYKWDDVDQAMAAFVLSYVDDLRTGSSKGRQDCERITHVAGSKLNYLGEQDASRKRGEASQEPGAWAGSVIISKEGEGLYVSISQEKWDKVKGIVENYARAIDDGKRRKIAVLVNYKQLEKDTGFLVHVFMTYELLRPYLKGFYLTLNSWRYDRGKDGWKYDRRDWENLAEEFWKDGESWYEFEEETKRGSQGIASATVQVVQRFEDDIGVLRLMFQERTPSLRLIRGFNVARVLYGFGDASGAGFGSSWVSEDMGATGKQAVHYRFGRWGSESDGESSNFRELRNLVDTLTLLGKQGELSGVEIFIFTDNSRRKRRLVKGHRAIKNCMVWLRK